VANRTNCIHRAVRLTRPAAIGSLGITQSSVSLRSVSANRPEQLKQSGIAARRADSSVYLAVIHPAGCLEQSVAQRVAAQLQGAVAHQAASTWQTATGP
jgi:hypothetical protein